MTVVNDGERYTTYNLWGDGDPSDEAPQEYGKRFIVGYYLGDAPLRKKPGEDPSDKGETL